MHFNVYLEDDMGKQLAIEAEKIGKTRNALIREAVGDWLARRKSAGWPDDIMAFTGVPDFPALETLRGELAPPAEDPLA